MPQSHKGRRDRCYNLVNYRRIKVMGGKTTLGAETKTKTNKETLLNHIMNTFQLSILNNPDIQGWYALSPAGNIIGPSYPCSWSFTKHCWQNMEGCKYPCLFCLACIDGKLLGQAWRTPDNGIIQEHVLKYQDITAWSVWMTCYKYRV